MVILRSFDKAKKVIESCNNEVQLEGAKKYVNNFFRQFSTPLFGKRNKNIVMTDQFISTYYNELLKLIEEKRSILSVFLIGLLFSISSCSKDEIIIVEVPGIPNSIELGNYGAPQYNSISNSTGIALRNRTNPGFYVTRENAPIPLDTIINGKTYMAVESALLIFDYNNDGKDDIFAHLMESTPCASDCNWITGPGKWLWWEDYKNTSSPIIVDSHLWFGVRFELGDFNGDGLIDVVASNQNHHQDGSGGYYSDYHPLEIINFNQTNLNIRDVGPPSSAHDLTTGDIDNDGDIDIIEAEWLYGANDTPSTPKFFINNGSGDFTITKELFGPYNIFQQERYFDFSVTNIDLFDFNNDGYLDLLVGENNIVWDWWSSDILEFFELSGYHPNDLTVMFGDGTGAFGYENSHSIRYNTPTAAKNVGVNVPLMGGNFIDFNNDGYFDYVVATDYNASGAGFKLFQNVNGTNLLDVTDTVVDRYVLLYKNASSGMNAQISKGDMSSFFDTMVIDQDGDGDFDIMPFSQVLMDHNSTMKSGVYWENIGGTFILKNF